MTTKPWVRLKAVWFNPKRKLWLTTTKTPGARTHQRFSASTFAEIIILYLAHNFDRESLIAAAEMAVPREVMISRVRSIDYQSTRKELPT